VNTDPVVAVVEDDPDLAELYAAYLEPACAVRVAETGEAALSALDEAVDVVVLDRDLGEWHGDDIVAVVRERDLDCAIAMVTGVEPAFDIVDLPVDDYLTKPVTKEDLRRTVEELLYRLVGGSDRQELLALVSRRLALEARYDDRRLEREPAYETLRRRIRLAEEGLDLAAEPNPSKHRPDACPECGLRWDVRVDETVGYVHIGARVWKCRGCGRVVNLPDPSDRRVARR